MPSKVGNIEDGFGIREVESREIAVETGLGGTEIRDCWVSDATNGEEGTYFLRQ